MALKLTIETNACNKTLQFYTQFRLSFYTQGRHKI